MVLLAAAVCNRTGKALVSRQFVDMTRARIEGLLAAFPKLMNAGKQHTFVETDSVRYVYQPLEKLFVVLITTKASNILEDLETLRLFARVVPDYTKSLDESDIIASSFKLIFAFDEIVALGYRESINVSQIQTILEMDSHEEKIAIAVKETQEREAKATMKSKQKELDRARRDAAKRGIDPYSSGISGGMGSSRISSSASTVINPEKVDPVKTTSVPRKTGGKGMTLPKGKGRDVDKFVGDLMAEGVAVENIETGPRKPAAAVAAAAIDSNKESVHIGIEEKMICVAGRDGGMQTLELTGQMTLLISDSQYDNISIQLNNDNPRNCQMQTHPHLDKNRFQNESKLVFKNPSKRFPMSTDVGVLKWRFVSTDDSQMPLTINCWPNPSKSGCDVNIEYELQYPAELNDVTISIPITPGVGAPKVTECDGDYRHDSRKNILEWTLPVIDESNSSGTLEFNIAGHEDDFFPVSVSFVTKTAFSNISIAGVSKVEEGSSVKYSTDTLFFPERYEIV